MAVKQIGTPGALPATPAVASNLGQGIKFPLQFDASGRLMLSSGIQSVNEAVLSICITQAGERPMQPDYGAGAADLFEPANAARTAMRIQDCIEQHEGRITSVSVNIDNVDDPTAPSFDVNYQIAGDANVNTLTFPIFQPPA